MSPDRATMEASRPRCRAVVESASPDEVLACDHPLRYDAITRRWSCPKHGWRFTAAQLLERR